MKNSLLYKIESKVIICVKGNNIERFIHRLVNNNIELLEIKQIKYNEVHIAIYEHDYKKVLNNIWNFINWWKRINKNKTFFIKKYIFNYLIFNLFNYIKDTYKPNISNRYYS